MKHGLVLVACLLALSSCSITKGLEERKEVVTNITNNIGAGGLMYFTAPVSTERLSGDQTLPTTSTQTTDAALALPSGGSIAGAKAGEGIQTLKSLDALQDKRVRDSYNPVTQTQTSTSTGGTPSVIPAVVPVGGSGSGTSTGTGTTTDLTECMKILEMQGYYQDTGKPYYRLGKTYTKPLKIVGVTDNLVIDIEDPTKDKIDYTFGISFYAGDDKVKTFDKNSSLFWKKDGSTSVKIYSPEECKFEYETRFHHTTTGYKDGGKSVVMCPGQRMEFDECSVGSVNIPKHSDDEEREMYWNMKAEPVGPIACRKGDKKFYYPADKPFVEGTCK